jgi:glutamate dehydrogenase/leucine dehydrogenase
VLIRKFFIWNPVKQHNAGGVATSGLEMAQNSHAFWLDGAKKIDNRLTFNYEKAFTTPWR